MCGVCLMLSRRFSSVPITKDTVHDQKNVFPAFYLFRRKEGSCFLEAEKHNKYIYLIMEGQEG